MSRNLEISWNGALTGAAGSEPEKGIQLFYERREDLVLTVTDRTRPVSGHTYTCGAAALGPNGRAAFQSDPVPDDMARLAALVADDRPRVPAAARNRTGADAAPSMLNPDEAARIVAELADRAARIQRGAAVSARWVGFEQRVRVARSGGPVVRDVRSAARVRVEARMQHGDTMAEAVAEAALTPDRPGSREKLIGLAHQVTERLERRLDAAEPPAGEACVVMAPGAGGVLIHELVGHALEADVVLAGDSWLSRFKERWIPEDLTVIDDPRRGRAAWRFDDEGEPARATPLLRGGRVAGWLHDRATAARSGQRTTGHGRRASFREPILPRMGATFVAPGSLSPEEVIEGAREGVYVRRMEAARTDPRAGRAVFRVSDADLILGGRVGRPLEPFLLHVDGQAALRGLTRVADDLRFDTCIGSCHRDGQPLAISVGAPTFCIGVAEVAS